MNAAVGSVASIAGGELGVLCAYQWAGSTADAREVDPAEIEAALAGGGVTWLHLNLSNARARQLLAQAPWLPEEVRDLLCTHEPRRRVEAIPEGLIVVVSDLTFEEGSEPEEVGTLWCFATPGLLVSGRTHPLQTPDRLRRAVRAGLRAATAYDLLLWILGQRTTSLRDLTVEMSERVSEIEDEILGGRIREQREQLGRIRRFCAQLRRHFGPDRNAFRRLLQQATLGTEATEGIRLEVDELSFLIDEVLELYERSKLLQEELASRVAENTGRSLYVLAILSAAFLPMTLITGIFGMNVAGLPGLVAPGAFWRVMLLIVAAGALTLAFISRRDRG